MENKALWDSVKVTNPSAVKKITGKSYQGNSPKPYWLIERATDTFGPIGIGWGVTVKSERFERMGEHDVLHVATVAVWYVLEGKRSETFEQMGGTKAAYMSSAGKLIVDEDAGKKSVTDAMVKCLSMIGFCADIFSGMWDDSKYVEWAAEQYEEKPPTLSAQQVADIDALISEVKADKPALLAWLSHATGQVVAKLADAPAEAYPHIVKRLEAKRKAAR
jgi:hypothetical protein